MEINTPTYVKPSFLNLDQWSCVQHIVCTLTPNLNADWSVAFFLLSDWSTVKLGGHVRNFFTKKRCHMAVDLDIVIYGLRSKS